MPSGERGAHSAGGGGGEGEARGAKYGRRWRRRWRGRRRSRSGGERVAVSKTPARAVRSPFRLTCLRTAPTGGEEGGEPAGALCRGRRALVVCARSPRAGGRQVTEASGERARGQCVCRDSQIAKSNKKTVTRPRRQQTLQWSASARRAPQVVLRFEKPPAFLSHRLVQLRLDRWQRKASRRIRDHRGWTPRRPALRRTPPNHHAGASSQRVSRCTPDGQRAPMAAWARRAPWPACRYEAQLLGRGAP